MIVFSPARIRSPAADSEISLPYRFKSDRGNSVFVDDQFTPHADQWKFLSGIRKIGQRQAEHLVNDARKNGSIVGFRLFDQDDDYQTPWATAPSRRRKQLPIQVPLPSRLHLTLGYEIYIAKAGLLPALHDRFLRLAAFQNLEFYRAQAIRLPTYNKPRIIDCADDHANHLSLLRGCLDDIRQLLSDLKVEPVIRDERFHGRPLKLDFCGELHEQQQVAGQAILQEDIGVLSATTAFGKTVIAA